MRRNWSIIHMIHPSSLTVKITSLESLQLQRFFLQLHRPDNVPLHLQIASFNFLHVLLRYPQFLICYPKTGTDTYMRKYFPTAFDFYQAA